MNYSRSDIEHMRQDALRRTREMHSRAKTTDNEAASAKQEDDPSKEMEGKAVVPEKSILGDLLPGLKIEGDKLLLMLLIIILSNEGADMKLLLALGYILL